MKTTLLILATFSFFIGNAQTTHNLNWERNIAGTGNADLTIETGDTVIWTWLDANHTIENDPANSVETFNSGILAPVGSIFSYTFTTIGANDYFCGIHGAGSMSGTITVTEELGIEDKVTSIFNIEKNLVDSILNISLSQSIADGTIIIYDLLGKQVLTQNIINSSYLTFNISELNKGLYMVSINSENRVQTKRFIKK